MALVAEIESQQNMLTPPAKIIIIITIAITVITITIIIIVANVATECLLIPRGDTLFKVVRSNQCKICCLAWRLY